MSKATVLRVSGGDNTFAEITFTGNMSIADALRQANLDVNEGEGVTLNGAPATVEDEVTDGAVVGVSQASGGNV